MQEKKFSIKPTGFYTIHLLLKILIIQSICNSFNFLDLYRLGGTSPCSTGDFVFKLWHSCVNTAITPFSPVILPVVKQRVYSKVTHKIGAIVVLQKYATFSPLARISFPYHMHLQSMHVQPNTVHHIFCE